MLELPGDKLGASTDRDAREWLVRLSRAVRETLAADRVIVWLYDAPGQAVSLLASDEPNDPVFEDVAESWSPTPLDSFPAACDVLLRARPIEVRDAQNDAAVPPELAADLLLDSIHFEPILAGRAIGMLSIEPAAAAANPELQSLVPLVAAAVGRATTSHESDRERRRTAFMLELTEAATAAESIDALLATICQRIARELRVRRGTIFLREGARLVAKASRQSDGSYDSAVWERMIAEPAPAAAEAAVQSGKPVVARDPDSPLIPPAWVDSFGVGSALAVPLGRDPMAIGALVLDDPEPNRFPEEAVEVAAAAAEHVAPAIERMLESDEQTLHLFAAVAIRRLLEEGAGAVSVQEAGEVLARVIRDALNAERATLLLQDEEERIRLVISVGADGDFERVLQERIESMPLSELRIWRLTTRQPKPVFVENASASRLIPADLVEALGLKSYVAVPLLSASRPLGLVLCSHSSAPRRWTNEERQLVAQIALEGSLVVENAVLRATEHERIGVLRHQAFHDALTKLPNRALFADRLQHALDRMSRRQQSIAVLFLDLDEFKPINDNYGHDAGDRLLVAVSDRLQSCLRPEDTIARLGGDEFTVLLEDITDARYAIRVAERIAEALRPSFKLDGHEASVTASIGIAVGTGRESTPDELLRNSDRAMYQAKYGGKARYVVYHDGMPQTQADAAPAPEPAEEPLVDDAEVTEHADALTENGALVEEPLAEETGGVEGVGLFGRTERPPEEELQSEAENTEVEDAGTEDAEAEDAGAEAAAAAEPSDVAPPADSAAPSPLSEARRRRRLRFPPR